jgi:hypothetical protein
MWNEVTKYIGQNITTANSRLASCGVTCKLEALCFYSGSVRFYSFVLMNPQRQLTSERNSPF